MATNFKISDQIPKIYQKCHDVFGVNWSKGIIITYGDTVYSKYPIAPDLMVHEGVHVDQQLKMGVEKWWDKYFDDPDFRFDQEKEAYIAQSKWIKKNIKDKNRKYLRLLRIARDFSSGIYGNVVSFDEAKKLLC